METAHAVVARDGEQDTPRRGALLPVGVADPGGELRFRLGPRKQPGVSAALHGPALEPDDLSQVPAGLPLTKIPGQVVEALHRHDPLPVLRRGPPPQESPLPGRTLGRSGEEERAPRAGAAGQPLGDEGVAFRSREASEPAPTRRALRQRRRRVRHGPLEAFEAQLIGAMEDDQAEQTGQRRRQPLRLALLDQVEGALRPDRREPPERRADLVRLAFDGEQRLDDVQRSVGVGVHQPREEGVDAPQHPGVEAFRDRGDEMPRGRGCDLAIRTQAAGEPCSSMSGSGTRSSEQAGRASSQSGRSGPASPATSPSTAGSDRRRRARRASFGARRVSWIPRIAEAICSSAPRAIRPLHARERTHCEGSRVAARRAPTFRAARCASAASQRRHGSGSLASAAIDRAASASPAPARRPRAATARCRSGWDSASRSEVTSVGT